MSEYLFVLTAVIFIPTSFISSLVLRKMHEANLVDYSYFQNTGLHWGAGMAISNYLARALPECNKYSIALHVGGILSFFEIGQQLNAGNGDLEDVLANFGGAILGVLLPDAIKMAGKAKDYIAENYLKPEPQAQKSLENL